MDHITMVIFTMDLDTEKVNSIIQTFLPCMRVNSLTIFFTVKVVRRIMIKGFFMKAIGNFT